MKCERKSIFEIDGSIVVIILEKRPDEQYSKFKIKIEPSGILIEPDKGAHEQQRLCPSDRKCFIYGLMLLRADTKKADRGLPIMIIPLC